ncbi:DNA cytosine methyltransferase [Rhodovulum sulfidophilum]|uniref:DNA cytosine methyltransferase n=1 Tax=Rhodovulum sulfidophilum TaxID=35806 RepID=UPI001923C6E9|nr:DNA cytosine methyltransferase [Rhodovulum sulfidophilum]MBL3575327.1 DNA cytosine methyltransferase [Rhodovulum sulfidophilum]MBL3587681.1 DNA cytosine methyltransferase [Rhodovulum sulfidophilum]MCE8421170.1 DNA cytosine methyltransferase [Rhodovulum sulfidophilum]MCE8433224.1 DNA cytosine methyltransferase [Rhodovulum sulfidophilum]MCF4115755.1 DNA cytosine methyltransferase [Rhodovulum sulfidophilum]
MRRNLTSVELCAGAGGQALGVEQAGFDHQACVEVDDWCRKTLNLNRPSWNVLEGTQCDLTTFDARPYAGVDLVAGGVPCPPFSKAGKQLGAQDERDLFPAALRVVDEVRPKAVMLENVRGFLDAVFHDYRLKLKSQLKSMGYSFVEWHLFNACDFGVSQLRPRVAIVAVHQNYADKFEWPKGGDLHPPTVGECLRDLMSANGWTGAEAWAAQADEIAPTIVGGSKKHGGPDLGPTRARRAWEALGVNGKTIAEEAPAPGFEGMPRLTVRMVARLQGFPDDWAFAGRKTAAYRQVGNAFPPPVARAVARNIHAAITARRLHAVA